MISFCIAFAVTFACALACYAAGFRHGYATHAARMERRDDLLFAEIERTVDGVMCEHLRERVNIPSEN